MIDPAHALLLGRPREHEWSRLASFIVGAAVTLVLFLAFT